MLMIDAIDIDKSGMLAGENIPLQLEASGGDRQVALNGIRFKTLKAIQSNTEQNRVSTLKW
ncbi:hypothetical protein [Paenibacillus sp. NPDC055715]